MSDELRDRLALAWGLLCHMMVDRSDPSLSLASEARRQIGVVLTKEDKARGIEAARQRMQLIRVSPPLIDEDALRAAAVRDIRDIRYKGETDA